ncbi:SDR family NAD(P)-dependent oxidoreductase [Dyadobacter sp. BHUBP1]|uniref:SDR family NAD(P)-dependent oxidoreductase n=1 Tax=Dyadobacter sp. BHUBP1 TaxID=3424178 RepID=UPI003D3412AC
MNLAKLDAVRDFAYSFIQKHHRLDILINNAGVMTQPPSMTDDGFELQFGVNFLGHYAIARIGELMDPWQGHCRRCTRLWQWAGEATKVVYPAGNR